ncbi:MAG TPA: hypothetical protein VFZ89_16225 [Solirubrobacteraceae bacterium]
MTRRLLLVCAVVLVAAAPATAAPQHSGTLAVGGEVAWDGGPLNGLAVTSDISDVSGCQPGIAECDDTLLKVDAAGVLSVKIGDASAGAADLDLYVQESDAAGKEGEIVKVSAGPTAEESTSLDVEPGYFLVRVRAALSLGGTYKGTAKLDAPTALPPPPGSNVPAANKPPTVTVTKPGTRVTAIRGTAADDGTVARVRVGVVRKRGKACHGLTAKGTWTRLKTCTAPPLRTARGTTRWSLALKRPLTKGRYVAYAVATDDKGLRGTRASVAFTVR